MSLLTETFEENAPHNKNETPDQENRVEVAYSNDVGKYKLLTHEQEIECGTIIQEAITQFKAPLIKSAKAANASSKEISRLQTRPLTGKEIKTLKEENSTFKDAYDTMANANYKLVIHRVIEKWNKSSIHNVDLIEEGNIGLLHAIQKYDPTKKDPRTNKPYKFSTYATWWIDEKVGRYIKNTERTIKTPIHAHAEIKKIHEASTEFHETHNRWPTTEELSTKTNYTSQKIRELQAARTYIDSLDREIPIDEDSGSTLRDTIPDELTNNPVDILQREEQKDPHKSAIFYGQSPLYKAFSQLTEEQQEILRRHDGLFGTAEDQIETIAADLSLSVQAIKYRRNRAVEALTKIMNPAPA